MNKQLITPFFVACVYLLLFNSCGSSGNPKKKMAVSITNEACGFLSEVISAFTIGAANGVLDEVADSDVPDIEANGVNLVPGYLCECCTYYISQDLAENFSMDDLRAIRADNVKKIWTLTQLAKAHQEEIKHCIETTTNEKFKSYADFERKLNRKLKGK